MNSYELACLFPSDFSEEENNKIKTAISSILEKNKAKIENIEKPIVKDLGYAINNKKASLLITILFNSNPEKIETIEKELKEKKELLRFLITKKDKRKRLSSKRRTQKPPEEGIKKDSLKKEKKKEEVKKERPKVEFQEIEKKLNEILGEQ